MTISLDWAEEKLKACGRKLEELPVMLKGAEDQLDSVRRQARESARRVSEREAELKLEIQADPALKNKEQRDVAFHQRAAKDSDLVAMRKAASADEGQLAAAQAGVDEMKREFRASEVMPGIIDSLLRIEDVRRFDAHQAAKRIAAQRQPQPQPEQGA